MKLLAAITIFLSGGAVAIWALYRAIDRAIDGAFTS